MIKISGTLMALGLCAPARHEPGHDLDYLLGIIAAVSALYIVLDYEASPRARACPPHATSSSASCWSSSCWRPPAGSSAPPCRSSPAYLSCTCLPGRTCRFPCLQGRIPVPLHLPDDDGYGRHLRRAAARFGHRRLPLRAVRDNARTGRRRQFLHPARHQRLGRFRGGAAKPPSSAAPSPAWFPVRASPTWSRPGPLPSRL